MADPAGSDQAPEPGDDRPPAEAAPSPIFENRVLMKADGILDALAGRLKDALSQRGEGAPGPVLLTLVRPVGVRAAPTPSAPAPARLSLPDGASELLGAELETHLTIGGGQVKLWLAGLERVPVGSTIEVAASRADGPIAAASAVVEDGASPVRVSIPWDEESPPEAIALGFGP